MRRIVGGGPGEKAGRIPRRLLPDTEIIGPHACPLMKRWTLAQFRGRKLLVHYFMPNGEDRSVHDHPSPFVTLVVRGYYDDVTLCPTCNGLERIPDPELVGVVPSGQDWMPCETCMDSRVGPTGVVHNERMRPGRIRFRAAEHRHLTKAGPRGCWTIVLMGLKRRRWGFWENGRWYFWRDHERLFGFGMRCPEDVRSTSRRASE